MEGVIGTSSFSWLVRSTGENLGLRLVSEVCVYVVEVGDSLIGLNPYLVESDAILG